MNNYRWAALIFLVFAIYPYLSGEFALSVIPGWHTPIFSLLASLNIAGSLWMLILACIYIGMNKRQPLRGAQIWQHILLSILPLLAINMLEPLLDSHDIRLGLLNIELFKYALFFLVQIWFVVALVLAVRKQKKVPV